MIDQIVLNIIHNKDRKNKLINIVPLTIQKIFISKLLVQLSSLLKLHKKNLLMILKFIQKFLNLMLAIKVKISI